MNSTSESKSVLEVNDLNIHFDLDYHFIASVREKFIQAIKDPIDFFSPSKDKLHVLKGIQLSLNHGDRLGIIGVNGSGKTTLCRCIAGMYSPSKGSVNINGEVRAIFDTSVGILPELTGRENAQLLSQFLFPSISKDERKAIIDDALEFSELGHFLDTPYRTYSKGMQTRLSLSLISSKATDLLILDEVFDGADEFFQEKISKRVLKMIHQSGAVIFVSHSPDQVLQACNRAIFLNNGHIEIDGSPEEVIAHYRKANIGGSVK
ncbi:MAG: ABC transporter ATP-binding protein [Halobacteriovorax sp.]|nr:ABC transporter ATP-binding protein [Halobacteriovorax sp.]|tara:strand:- start:289 stop:1077 length:789 start_codon:yes stop_codon:yes gene_type:complete